MKRKAPRPRRQPRENELRALERANLARHAEAEGRKANSTTNGE